MRTTPRRVAAFAVGSALTLSGLVSSAASADSSPAQSSAATWVAGELTNGLFHFVIDLDPDPDIEYDDYGLSIDAGFTELSTGNTAVAGEIRNAVASHINDYITGEAFGDAGSTYAGPTAKALVYAQESGGTPTSYGGVNLVSRLESVVSASGRLVDVSTFGDNANTIGQSFAARGLTTAGSAKAAVVSSFLLKQQCPAGYFRLAMSDAQCADNAAPDTDVTAFAVLNLQGQRQQPQVAAALTKANAWLLSTQAADGSFGGGGVTAAPNTNSTGLAAWALGESCQVAAADRAAAYVRGFQVPAGQTGPLSTEVGAVAYDAAARSLGQTQGITDATSDQWRRATAQAAPGLTWDPNGSATVQVSAPKGFIKGGELAKVTITGAAAGERVCLTDSHGGVAILTGTGSPLTHQVATAKRTHDLNVSATTGPGSATDEIQVLGRDRLKPRLARSVTQGDKVVVKLKKLGAKEKVKLFVDGKLVAKGKANKKGVFAGRFVARFKVGTHQLTAVGQFKNRRGATTFRVVG